ncbi:hypothetical protein Tco_0112089 [Tanacetum coccineum]
MFWRGLGRVMFLEWVIGEGVQGEERKWGFCGWTVWWGLWSVGVVGGVDGVWIFVLSCLGCDGLRRLGVVWRGGCGWVRGMWYGVMWLGLWVYRCRFWIGIVVVWGAGFVSGCGWSCVGLGSFVVGVVAFVVRFRCGGVESAVALWGGLGDVGVWVVLVCCMLREFGRGGRCVGWRADGTGPRWACLGREVEEVFGLKVEGDWGVVLSRLWYRVLVKVGFGLYWGVWGGGLMVGGWCIVFGGGRGCLVVEYAGVGGQWGVVDFGDLGEWVIVGGGVGSERVVSWLGWCVMLLGNSIDGGGYVGLVVGYGGLIAGLYVGGRCCLLFYLDCLVLRGGLIECCGGGSGVVRFVAFAVGGLGMVRWYDVDGFGMMGLGCGGWCWEWGRSMVLDGVAFVVWGDFGAVSVGEWGVVSGCGPWGGGCLVEVVVGFLLGVSCWRGGRMVEEWGGWDCAFGEGGVVVGLECWVKVFWREFSGYLVVGRRAYGGGRGGSRRVLCGVGGSRFVFGRGSGGVGYAVRGFGVVVVVSLVGWRFLGVWLSFCGGLCWGVGVGGVGWSLGDYGGLLGCGREYGSIKVWAVGVVGSGVGGLDLVGVGELDGCDVVVVGVWGVGG